MIVSFGSIFWTLSSPSKAKLLAMVDLIPSLLSARRQKDDCNSVKSHNRSDSSKLDLLSASVFPYKSDHSANSVKHFEKIKGFDMIY